MGMRLEKLSLPSQEQIKSLPVSELLSLAMDWRDRLELYQEQLFREKRHRYGSRSERTPSVNTGNGEDTAAKPRDEVTKRPSERYPDATVVVEIVEISPAPTCECCGEPMADSGMTEDAESIGVKEKQFIVVDQKRAKYRCTKCHGSVVTAPLPPRVAPGGSYSDDVIVDATLSKYCDLIPMERYTKIAGRCGMPGLPPQSLIQTTFRLAEFMDGVYEKIRKEVLDSRVVYADETPHRMLEGDERTRWFLWGFMAQKACFFECHGTRSGEVSSTVLKASQCEVLVSDVYSGYRRSVREVNEWRAVAGIPPLTAAYCNAHARRGFVTGDGEVNFMLQSYKEIYRLEALPLEPLERRAMMRPVFERMRDEATAKVTEHSSKSQLGRAYAYFLNNYEGLTVFLDRGDVAIDNNGSERLLRNPVIGRKTWYGTHSREGAEVAAVHFTLVETCKLNGVNPREYYLAAIERIHRGEEVWTPADYRRLELLD
jgi:transposase